jgi:inhibitor of KinA sporulation pathway (predicted exonuclease)
MDAPKTPFAAIVDFEATCGDGIPGHEMEIIEFAAILVDATWTPLGDGEFCRFTRPSLHPLLSQFCRELTTIPQYEVDWAPSFPEVVTEFSAWMEQKVPTEEVTFCSWGDFDKRQLHKECERWRVPYPFTSAHVNLRTLAARRLGLRKGQRQGLFAVTEFLGLPFLGTHHRGIDDCRNAVEIFKKITSFCETTQALEASPR